MADAPASNAPTYIAILLIVVAVVGLVYLARDVAQGTFRDIKNVGTPAATATSSVNGSAEQASERSSMGASAASWVTYADQAWDYRVRFPSNYRARLIDSGELVSPIPGEVILSGIVVAPAASVTSNRTPDYAKESLTLLVTDWSAFGSSQDFLSQTYVNGAVPRERIERVTVGGRPALRLRVDSVLGGVSTSHTELLIAGPGTRVVKILYWPADHEVFAGIADSTMIAQ